MVLISKTNNMILTPYQVELDEQLYKLLGQDFKQLKQDELNKRIEENL